MNKVVYLFLIVLLSPLCALAVTDSDTSNNLVTISINSTQTRNLTVHYILVSNEEEEYPSSSSVDLIRLRADPYMQAIYPVENVSTVVLNSRISYGEIENYPTSVLRRLQLYKRLEKISLSSSSSHAERVAGIVATGTIDRVLGGGDGWADRGGNGMIVDENRSKEDYYAVAHEIGHNYGLCDEYSSSKWFSQNVLNSCPNGDENNNELLDTECSEIDPGGNYQTSSCRALTLRELHPFDNSINTFGTDEKLDIFRSFMGFDTSNRLWISKSSYDYLLDDFRIDSDSYGDSLLISGLFHKDGTYTVDDIYFLTGVRRTYPNESGNFSIVLSNATGEIARANRAPYFVDVNIEGESVETNESAFVFLLPYDSSIETVEFLYNGTLQEQINRSTNTPNIELTFPTDNESFVAPFNVTWDASDVDNDNLTYILQLSADSGVSWSTLAVDLSNTYYGLDNADFPYGTNYRLKIIVSDGFNTNSSESSADFTIVPPPRVTANNISEIYSLQERKIFEASAVNDGSQDLEYFSWAFDLGEENVTGEQNLSLAVNQEFTLLFEQEYAFGGERNISFMAYDENKSVNDTFSLSTFVGDLRVTNLTLVFENGTQRTFNFTIYNAGEGNLTGINWTLRTGETNASADSLLSLSPLNSTTVSEAYTYTDSGVYNIRIIVWNDFNNDSDDLEMEILDLVIDEYELLSQIDAQVITEFVLTNYFATAPNVQWSVDTGEETIVADTNISLDTSQSITILVEKEYATFDSFIAIANAADGAHSTSQPLAITVAELLVQNLASLATSGTVGVQEINVRNAFASPLNATWLFDTNASSQIVAEHALELAPDENITLLIEHNFTSTGTYEITAGANTSAATYTDALNLTLS